MIRQADHNSDHADAMLYRRQFLASTDDCRIPLGWYLASRILNLAVHAHPDLATTCATNPEVDIVCLGTILDPRNPERSNQSIVDEVSNTHSYDELERVMLGLGGRWVLIARIREDLRVYPDAAGTKSIFYTTRRSDGAIQIGSQPQLIGEACGIARDASFDGLFRQHPHQNSWPGQLTPFPGIQQLLPNHFLDVRTGHVSRFWPRQAVNRVSLEDGAQTIAELLSGTIGAVCHRGPAALPLTGGYDSRLLFACSKLWRSHVPTFVVSAPNTPFHDISVPRQLARKFNVPFRVMRSRSYTKQFEALVKRNVADMVWDPGMRLIYTFADFEEGTRILFGQIAEVGRCFYYKDGSHPDRLSAAELASTAGYAGNPIAIEQITNWKEALAFDHGIDLLDQYYWEHRLGNWGGMLLTAFDTVVDVVQVYNCRELLTAALGVDVEHRRSPHRLARRVCEITEPDVLRIGFNQDWRDDLADSVKRLMPWRWQSWWYRTRLKWAGLGYEDGLP